MNEEVSWTGTINCRSRIRRGVTRVGVTRGAQLTVSPYFFPEKNWRPFFLVIALVKVMTFLAVVSSQLPPSDVVCPVFFLNHSGVTPGWCRPPPLMQFVSANYKVGKHRPRLFTCLSPMSASNFWIQFSTSVSTWNFRCNSHASSTRSLNGDQQVYEVM